MSFPKLQPKIINYRGYKFFNRNVPIEVKYIHLNEAPFMTKKLHKAIMRTKLTNKFLKSKTLSNRKTYKSQRNRCKNELFQ